MSFNFGSNPAKTATGVTLGTPTNPATSTPGFNLGAPGTITGLSFGSTTPSVPGYSLGGAGDSSKTPSNLPTPTQTATVKPIAATAPQPASFALAATPNTTPATTGFPGFGLTPTTTTPQTSAPSFSFGSSAPPATTSAVSFSLTPTTSTLKLGVTSTPSLSQITTPAATATTTLLTSTAPTLAALPTNSITFVQLEETINKWTSELQDQEKIFMSQASQINNWDGLLNSNSDKIVQLNSEVAEMKLQQQQLDHELDFIVGQQRELEEVLAPLEKQAAEAPTNTDPEREHIYHMGETLDTQLKQMSEDLKEIIEHINESSRTQDNSDPIVQIGRILNAHMNSLHWIDQTTLNIQNQLENVTKLHDIHRRENERSFRISYE